MSAAETLGVAGAIISILVGFVTMLMAYVYTSNKSAVDKSISSLETQNRSEALDIERLKQRAEEFQRHDERVLEAVERLNDKIDELKNEVASLRRAGGTPGQFPAVRPPR